MRRKVGVIRGGGSGVIVKHGYGQKGARMKNKTHKNKNVTIIQARR
jgi:hypothetical protein